MRAIWFLILILVSPFSEARSQVPDERILWQLLHAGRLRLLTQAIQEYRQNHPGWEPPAVLLQELQRRQRRQAAKALGNRIAASIRKQDWPRLIRLARKHPRLFDCRHPGRLQALALAYGRTGHAETAFRLYRRLLRCPGVDSAAVLEQAVWNLSTTRFARLLEHARKRLSTPARQRLCYQLQRRRLLELYRRQDFAALERLAGQMTADIKAHRDLDLIRLLAWTAYDRKNWQTAARWFETGLALAPEDESLAYGLALAYRQLRQGQTLLQLAARFPRSARIRHLAGGYLLAEAWQAYRRCDFDEARHLARQALSLSRQREKAEYLLGWIAVKTGRFDEAKRRFARLHRTHPDNQDYAEALILAYRLSGSDLHPLLATASPLLRSIVRSHLARQDYRYKRFLSAYQTDPAAFPQLQNIDSPSFSPAALYRYKSGSKGLDRLETLIVPLFTGTYIKGNQRFTLTLGRVSLSSGKLRKTDIPRLTADLALQNRLRANRPVHAVNGAWIRFSYEGEGRGHPFFSAGLTPVNHLIAPRPTFRLGFRDRDKTGHIAWRIEGYSQPVRQSLLSYTGWKVLGKRWGRVLRSGLRGQLWNPLGGNWGLFQQLDLAFLDGKRTKDNWTVHYSMAPTLDLKIAGFDLLSTGPYFDFQHYGNNQNHFRPGHGGYFSPQRFYATGWQLNLRTREGRAFLVEGRMALGLQHFHERSEPWFPIGCPYDSCEEGKYPRNRDTKFAPDFRVRMVGQVHPHLQVSGGVYARMTGDYKEIGAGIFLRWFFEPRKAVFSSDLPERLFSAVE